MKADRNEWSTPDEIFKPLHETYKFTVDACAVALNTKLPHYWTPEQDGLAQDWSRERVWCNPPYGRGQLAPWVWKAMETRYLYCPSGSPAGAWLLLPSRTDTQWFQALYSRQQRGYAAIRFLDKRVRFVPPAGIEASSPTEASILVRIWS